MKKTGRKLAALYKIPVRSAYYHDEGHWYWNLSDFPAAYFDANGYVIFQNEGEYLDNPYLSISSKNTNVRNKRTIADMPGYRKLDPPPVSL